MTNTNYEYISELINNQMWDKCYNEIIEGLKRNYRDYELYFALGEYYLKKNINQAYLCYQNALFYCDNDRDKEYIEEVMNEVKKAEIDVKPYSIIIVSYNSQDIMKLCLQTIRDNNNVIDNEIIVIDNNSTDGVKEWLENQEDIKLIKNSSNKGFGEGSNQGIKVAACDNDIFLLNNDTIITPNALFWLRMGLYENKKVGAVGCMSNNAAGQCISEKYDSIAEYIDYGIRNNIPNTNPYEKRVWLSGFALMFRRKTLDEVGLLDYRYGIGYYEDNDICIRLQYAGYQCILCHNSFIFHWGSQSFGEVPDRQLELMKTNRKLFKDKWKFDIDYYSYAREELISFIAQEKYKTINVLEIGCGCGATLSKIKYLWPESDVRGIELVDDVARIGANNYNIIQGNIETMNMDYPDGYFDYIIFGDVLEHLFDPEKVLEKVRRYMKKDARLLISIPNVIHMSVILQLLKGEFEYKDAGILDRTHVRFFTIKSAIKMIKKCGYSVESYARVINEYENGQISDSDRQEFFNLINNISGAAEVNEFETYQYIIIASK